MKSRISVALFAVILGLGDEMVFAEPFRYDSSSADIKEYVVDCITNCISCSDVALMHERTDEASHEEDSPLPWQYECEFGLMMRRCVEMLKGDLSLSRYKVCYLYKTPFHCARERPYLVDSLHAENGMFRYFQNGEMHVGRGKDIWKLDPPYDPYDSYGDEFVQMMFLTREQKLDVGRVAPSRNSWETNSIIRILGQNFGKLTADEIMKTLNVGNIFSNRVFRLNEGCAFQVDYPVPDMEWRGLGTKEEHLEHVKRVQADSSELMHLSSDEVSEIVYLSYLADKRYSAADYDAACRRCPKILKPVKEFKTEIGKRLKAAMESGGMLPKK